MNLNISLANFHPKIFAVDIHVSVFKESSGNLCTIAANKNASYKENN